MWKVVLMLPIVVLLAGCKDIVEDNGPNNYERERAMEWCIGKNSLYFREAPAELRIACTQAVYGG